MLKLNEAAEKLEKMLAIDLNTDDLSDQSKMSEKGSGGVERQSPKTVDKMDSTFSMQQERADNNSRTADSILPSKEKNPRPQLIDDNHSNISDSDIGDFPDDLDDSSNDSVKSSNSHGFMPRLTHKSNDVPMKLESDAKSELKRSNSNTELPYNFIEDFQTSDTTDSNSSVGKDGSHAFNLMRDCAPTASVSAAGAASAPIASSILDASRDTTIRRDQQQQRDAEPSSSSSSSSSSASLVKTSPISDTKLKSVSSCIGLSLDSALGSKSVDDDNAMSDLHTDNISDDEYDDIKPDTLTARKPDNMSMRKNENFESISKYMGPTPISINTLNTLISADYSNLSDNNDTSSNDNRDSNDSKRTENSPTVVKPASHDSTRITDKDIMEPGELLGKTLLEDSNLTSESLTGGDIGGGGKSIGMKSSFLADNNNHKDKSDNLLVDTVDLIESTKKTGDSFSLTVGGGAIGSKTDFSALHAIKTKESGDTTEATKSNNSNSSSGGGGGGSSNKPENRNTGEKSAKSDHEIYELNFLDEHDMNDSNQSGILGKRKVFISIIN